MKKLRWSPPWPFSKPTPGGLLTEEQHRQFRDQGWLVLHTGLPGDVFDQAIRDAEGHYPDPLAADGLPQPTRVQDLWRKSRAVHRIAVPPRVLQAMEELYGRTVLPFQTLNFPVGTGQLAHSDTIHFNSLPAGFMCGAWVALEDIHPDSGPLFYYPGSHQLPEYTLDHFEKPEPFVPERGERFFQEHYPGYERFIQKVIADFGLKPRVETPRKGEALLWAANLLHGGMPVQDRRRSRHSQVTHYYFEGCRYYTPIFTQGTSVFWRQPEWIPRL